MKKLILVLVLLFSSNIYANEPGDAYIGVQFGQSSLEVDGFDDIDNTYGLIRLGRHITSDITFDLRYGDGIGDDTLMGVDFSIDRIFGLYILYHLELSSTISIYGLIGYTEADLKAEANGGSLVEEDDDISYGIGLNIGNINVEFTQYLDGSDFEANAIGIGYNYYFE